MKIYLLLTFLGVIAPVMAMGQDDAFGPVECYKYARYHTDLPDDDKGISELCAMATDAAPAKCYQRATQNAGASRATAIALCRRRVLNVNRH